MSKADNSVSKPVRTVEPKVDVYEGDDRTLVVAEMPGVAKEDIAVKVRRGVLSISGEAEGVRYARSFRIHEDAASDGVDARYSNGLLRVTVPLRKSGKKRIDVHAA